MSKRKPPIPVFGPLRMVVVEVTTWCNLKCPGCNRTIGEERGDWKSRHMSLDDFKRIVANLPVSEQIVLHGVGEPTLNPEYPDIVRYARASGKFRHLVCITNALARDIDYYETLIAAGLDSFTVSVDSLTQAIADQTRTGTVVEKLAERLAAFKARNLPFSVSMVASRTNEDDILATLERLDEIGVATVHLQPYIQFGANPVGLDASALRSLCESLSAVQTRLRNTRISFPALAALAAPSSQPICPAPWLEPAVTVDGFLAPCCVNMDPAVLGFIDLKTRSWADIQQDTSYNRFIGGYCDEAPDFCVGCFNHHRSEMSRPLVSMTLVTYNQAPHVREAIEAALAQTYSPLEIIISDDASSDGTPDIVEACLAAYRGPHRIRFLKHTENLGGKGRENFRAAMQAANGRFIVWSCGDDRTKPEMVERMVGVWQREGRTLVTVNAEYIDEAGRPLGRCHRDPAATPNVSVESLARDGANDCNFGAGMGFAREMLEIFPFDASEPPPALAPDLIFPFYAGLLDGCAMIPEPLMYYRMHGAQTSMSSSHEAASENGLRLRIERDIWLGHLAGARYMAKILERAAAGNPGRFAPRRLQLEPLLAHQLTLMADRLVDVEQHLKALGAAAEETIRTEAPAPDAAEACREITALLESGDVLAAAERGYEVVKRYPSHAEAWYILAVVMHRAGSDDAALGLLTTACGLAPDEPFYAEEKRRLEESLASSVAEAPAKADGQPPELDTLSHAPFVTTYLVDICDECNLRCTYCHQTAPGFKGRHMPPAILERMRRTLLEHPPRASAILSSGGETTFMPGWTKVVGEFVATGVPCSIISNFARLFETEELDALAALQEILISIDTVDPLLTRNIRRKSDIKTILFNMMRLREHCLLKGMRVPRLVWNVVAYDQSLLRAESLAAAATFYRPDQVTFAQLKPIPGVGAEGARPVCDLDEGERNQCREALQHALDRLTAAGIAYSVNVELQIELGMAAASAPHAAAGPGQTRDCVMPWELLLTHSDGSVKPCCNAEGVTIGRIDPAEDPFDKVFNGEAMLAWRRGMLSGELPEACKTCNAYPLTTPQALTERVLRQFPHK